MLGDDALACLKDLRRWLRIYDEKTNRLDVARCMAAANLVKGDLLQILALWDQDVSEKQLLWRTALATRELAQWTTYRESCLTCWQSSSWSP